jgi:hypothetical protein
MTTPPAALTTPLRAPGLGFSRCVAVRPMQTTLPRHVLEQAAIATDRGNCTQRE